MKHETVDAGKQYKCEPTNPAKGSPSMGEDVENQPMTPKNKQIMGGMPDDHLPKNVPEFDY